MMAAVTAAAIVIGTLTAPLSAAAVTVDAVTVDQPRDDRGGVVVGVEITPRDVCAVGCAEHPEPGWRLADSGADIAPMLMLALLLGASGISVATAATLGRTRRLSRG